MSGPELTEHARRGPLRELIAKLGYGRALVREDYPVWTGDAILRPHLVAFASPDLHDVTTAAVVGNAVNGDVSVEHHFVAARMLATPVALLGRSDRWELWSLGPEAGSERQVVSDEWSRSEALARFADELAPGKILARKQSSRQLGLFRIDVQMLASARRAIEGTLAQRVVEAIHVALSDPDHPTLEQMNRAARLVVGALTALMIRDKVLDKPELEAHRVIAAAQQAYPRQFAWVDGLSAGDSERLARAMESVGENVNFSALDPALVSDVYENAIVSDAQRARLGAYYTPPLLASRVLEALPIEELDPERRHTIDLACGSGAFLVAAHRRLRGAIVESASLRTQNDYLQRHIRGADSDALAVEIARLALVLTAMPAGDGWNVETADALAAEPSSPDADIAVSNPPWRYSRATRARHEHAEPFLDRMLARLREGGLLACVLPAGWLTNGTSKESRRRLRERADVFEIWRLPENTFRSAQMAPCLVFARRSDHPLPLPYTFRQVGRSQLEEFLEEGITPDVALTRSEPSGTAPVRGSVGSLQRALAHLPKLGEIAEILSGPPPTKAAATGAEGGDVLWLPTARLVPPYARVARDVLRLVRYPEDFSRPPTASAEPHLHPKLLVSAKKRADNPWRVVVRIDEIGALPRETLYSLIPHDNDSHTRYALTAALGTTVTSALVHSESASRNIASEVYRRLPIPDPSSWPALAAVAHNVVDTASARRPLPTSLLNELEEVVWEAFGIPNMLRETLRRHFADAQAPERRSRFTLPLVRRVEELPDACLGSGEVLDVREGEVRLYVAGLTDEEGLWVSVPPGMPGSLCRPGQTFDVRGAELGLERARYWPQALAYMDLDTALEELGVT